MESDPVAAPSAAVAGDRDVGEAGWVEDFPVSSGGAVAEDGFWAAGEHRRHPSSLLAEAVMADGVDAAVDAMEALGLDATGHAAPANPGVCKLGEGDHPVLACGDLRDHPVRVGAGAFCTHVGA